MSALRVSSLLPFVPSGKDYEASRRLFRELGFEEEWESSGYAGCDWRRKQPFTNGFAGRGRIP